MTVHDDALRRLRAGNRRFVDNALSLDADPERRAAQATGQSPFAVVVGCADSRVPVEVVFDQGIGDLFVVRVAGNVVQAEQTGSVEFAVSKFGTSLIVVLGHSACGAIDAAFDVLADPAAELSPGLAAVVDGVRPAVEPLMTAPGERSDLVARAVRDNVRLQMRQLCAQSTLLDGQTRAGQLRIVGAEYVLDTGRVDFFADSPDT